MFQKNYRCPSCNPFVCPNKAVAPCVAHREIVSTRTQSDGSRLITLQDGTIVHYSPVRIRQTYQQVLQSAENRERFRDLLKG